MKILFVCSGNSPRFPISPFVLSQAKSLENLGHTVHFYSIQGKGISGYLRNVKPLRSLVKSECFSVVHAHYSLCAIIATLAVCCTSSYHPVKVWGGFDSNSYRRRLILVTSLLGSDVNGTWYWRAITVFFSRFFWNATIVKSPAMKTKLGLSKVCVLPNGINLDHFKEMDTRISRSSLGLLNDRKYVLFGAAPDRLVKNFALAKAAFEMAKSDDKELITIGSIPHNQVQLYMNACDVLILTSRWEGSPNIIKEAMACNCPAVSTDVGDVSWLFGNLAGYYIADSDPVDLAAKIDSAILFNSRTKGRQRLIDLSLDSQSVANELVNIYYGQKVATYEA